jgi:hypothetical protein
MVGLASGVEYYGHKNFAVFRYFSIFRKFGQNLGDFLEKQSYDYFLCIHR